MSSRGKRFKLDSWATIERPHEGCLAVAKRVFTVGPANKKFKVWGTYLNIESSVWDEHWVPTGTTTVWVKIKAYGMSKLENLEIWISPNGTGFIRVYTHPLRGQASRLKLWARLKKMRQDAADMNRPWKDDITVQEMTP